MLRLAHKKQLKGHNSGIYQLLEYNGDVLSCAGDGYVVRWQVNDESQDGHLIAKVDGQIFSMCIISDYLLVLGDMNGQVYWVDTVNNLTLKNYSAHKNGVYAILTDGDYVYSAGGDGFLTKWNVREMRAMESVQISHEPLRSLVGLENFLYIGSSDGNIYKVNKDTITSNIFVKKAHDSSVFCLARFNDFLFSGSRDAHLNRYDLITGEILNRIPAHWFTINDIVIIPKFDLLVTASRDKKIRLWNLYTLELIQSVDIQSEGHINSVNALLFHEPSSALVSAGDDRAINVYDIQP